MSMQAPSASSQPAMLAAVLHDGHGIAEPILHEFVQRLRRQGVHVHGLLQNSTLSCQDVSAAQRHMELVDIQNGERYVISQDLGAGSQACCLDAAGVVAASVVLRRALGQRPDLIVANRFGKLELEGSGLRQEMADAVAAGIPLLTAVDVTMLPAWQDFCGDMGVQLPADVEALEQWWRTVQQQQTTGSPEAH